MNRLALLVLATLLIAPPSRAEEPAALKGVKRVVFLGDSITYAGQYIEFVEAYLRARDPGLTTEFLDIGLPSETASGLSEPGHAGGQFPRPTVHERLERVLAKAKPDLVVASYGMNDGIYYPFGEDRFAKYREGIEKLRERAAAAGAKVLHLTPPVFDPVPIKARTLPDGLDEYKQPYEGYDDVLTRYAAWLVARKADGWDVIDVHTPMKQALDDARARDPKFRFAPDGVHIDAAGHWIIARALLAHWGVPAADLDFSSGEAALKSLPRGPEILKLVQTKQRLLKDAWLTDTGHKRPGMKKGLPLDEAEREARKLDDEIRGKAGNKP